MISIVRYINYTILLSIALYTGFLFQRSNQSETTYKKNDYHADAFLENVVAINMDKSGSPHSQLITKRIVHYPAFDTSFLTAPHFIIYSKDGQNPWHATSLMGKSVHGKEKIYLNDQVVIRQPPGPNNKDLTMTTSRLIIYPNKEYVETDKPVTFTEPGTIVNAIGMHAFLKERRVQLLSKTRGVHEEVAS